MPDPDQHPNERLKLLRSDLFKHFGKITCWKVLCQERMATTDQEMIRSGKELRRFLTQDAPVRRVAFAADVGFALCGGDDGVVRLWRLPE